MELSRVAALLERLVAKTKDKEIKWEEGLGDDEFTTMVNGFRLGLSRNIPDADYEVDPDYYLTIRKKDPQKPRQSGWIDSFSDQELKEVMPEAFKTMQSLFQEIRRQIVGVEEIVEDLIKSIDEMI